jgi:alanine dehydrogenase
MLDDLFDFEEIRVTIRRPASREAFAARLAEELGKPVRLVDVMDKVVLRRAADAGLGTVLRYR